nr:diaminopimelate decarboxylase [Bacteroidales bacterium]
MLKGEFPVDRFAALRTPFYFYDLPLLRRTLDAVQEQLDRSPDFRVHYAVKANYNPRILAEIAARGFGADCVSGGEVQAALEAGFPAEGIVYAGVGKSDEEIRLALQAGISRFNVESAAELEVIEELAGEMGCVAPVSLRINPDIGAHTHAGITTGLAENKFGINYEQLDEVMDLALSLPHVRYCGLHFHIGSQILDMSDFVALCNRINELVVRLSRGGRPVGDINVGGGLGINYQHPNHLPIADFAAYFDTFRMHLK